MFKITYTATDSVETFADINGRTLSDCTVEIAEKWAKMEHVTLNRVTLSARQGVYLINCSVSDSIILESTMHLKDSGVCYCNILKTVFTGIHDSEITVCTVSDSSFFGARWSGMLTDTKLRNIQINLEEAMPYIHNCNGIASVTGVGISKRSAYAYHTNDGVKIRLGCFADSPKEAIDQIRKAYKGEAGRLYVDSVKLLHRLYLYSLRDL